ncbi:alpha/beta hydrolase [Aestuariivita sp.]|uniref:alpha/beta hydrolase n=1 Tax=Aestuariivita sp. TaxID=1872407 RepID=UPI0021700D69|nr:alpha/beta hydrolase [Aestuariivita sp.]MCE8008450.1 alpha/beta hydrolase [Aestuariivita sp.]
MCVRSEITRPRRRAFDLVHRPAKGPCGLACWLALPEHIAPGAAPLVAVHGIRRGATLQARLFARRAAALGRPVIAPIFDETGWAGYQQACVRGRADLALLDLVSVLHGEGVVRSQTFDLFGFSGGAQFAHRFAMLHPDRVEDLTIASPGWYTFLDGAPYPYGLSPRPGHVDIWAERLIANLSRFLALSINVCVGERDCVVDKNTRSGLEINAQQGLHRLDRARRWSAALRAAAAAMGVVSDVRLHVLKDCGHDFENCVLSGGLDRIVIPDLPRMAHAPICRDTCSAQQKQACRVARAWRIPHEMDVSS